MSVRVASNRFIISSKYAALYQQIFSNISDFQTLGRRLVTYAEAAQDFRHVEGLEAAGTILSHLPIQEYRHIGQYYLAWCAYRKGESTQEAFEHVIERSATYKAKGLISLAAVVSSQGDYELGAKYYAEAVTIDPSPSIIVPAARSIAVIKSMHGDHRSALTDLEKIAPLARYATPKIYYDYLNSFAVELAEGGHVKEACNISRVVLASPYAFAYPEWRKTWQDLAIRGYKSSSSVPIIRKIPVVRKVPGNVLYMPERERSEGHRRSPFDLPRGVSILAEWKKKMVKEKGKEPNGNGEQTNTDEMSDKDLLFEIMNIASEDNITRQQLQEILDAARRIVSKKP